MAGEPVRVRVERALQDAYEAGKGVAYRHAALKAEIRFFESLTMSADEARAAFKALPDDILWLANRPVCTEIPDAE